LRTSNVQPANLKPGTAVISVSSSYFRPIEVDILLGNPGKANNLLGWEAQTKFEESVKIMMKADMVKVIEKGY